MKKEEKTREKERKCYEGGVDTSGADPEIFQMGLRRNILKEKCLIHVSTHVHIKNRQTCNFFYLLPFQEDCLLFFALFYYTLLFLKFERGGVATPVTPSRSANAHAYGDTWLIQFQFVYSLTPVSYLRYSNNIYTIFTNWSEAIKICNNETLTRSNKKVYRGGQTAS